MADRVKDVAAEEAERLKALTKDAVKSQAYLYPLKACQIEQSRRPNLTLPRV